jgi:negative regulator of sigma E activity
MTDPIHEQLSAFLDGELSAAESELLLKRVERDPDLKVRLERYVLAGEALRATAVQARPSRDFSTRVAAAIDGESIPARARRQAARWLKPVAGGAIAAGVAAVALVSFQVMPQGAALVASQDAARDSVATNEVGTLLVQTPVSQTSSSKGSDSYIVPQSGERRAAPPIQVVNNGRLANFVVAHSEYSSPLGRRNVLTGLVAEDLPADQPVEQFVVEQLAVDETAAPPPARPPVAGDPANRGMLSNSPR